MAKRPGELLLNIGVAVLAATVAFVVIEGLASALLLSRGLLFGASQPSQIAESRHTQYDADIGWVNVPSVYVEDLYSPGASLRINGQGFRSDRDVDVSVKPGTIRVFCSGDSFTLGFGVDDENPWCRHLTWGERPFETVNMGQGGYGIDQAWLWYKRDGLNYDHQLLVFAFIYHDFHRMTQLTFRRYGKPRVRYRDGDFVIENVPVPHLGRFRSWLRRHGDTFGSLRVFQLVAPIVSGPLSPSRHDEFEPYTVQEAHAVGVEIFSDLARVNARRGAEAVFVYLTTEFDLGGQADQSDRLREPLGIEMRRRGLHFVDLTADFRALSPEHIAAMFIQPGDSYFKHGKGHYTPQGHAFVAGTLSERLPAMLPGLR